MTSWLHLTFACDAGAEEILSVALHEQGSLGTHAESGRVHAWFPHESDANRVVDAVRREPDLGAVALLAHGIEPDGEWHERWMAGLEPIEAGNRMLVVPGRLPPGLERGKVVIRLVPGRAFGTGEHATTRLCLAALETVAGAGDSVLDVGTGSGILAIAACLLGCDPVMAFDTDDVAVDVAARNAALNRCRNRLQLMAGPIDALAPRPYDIVLANLTASTLIRLMPALAPRVRRAALLSGILRGEEGDVGRAAENAGLLAVSSAVEGDWVAIRCGRADHV